VLEREELAQALPDGEGHVGRGEGVGEDLTTIPSSSEFSR